MKFFDKYPQLKEKGFLAQMLTNTGFSTMSLENQQVSKPKVEEIVLSLLKEQELKGSQFFTHHLSVELAQRSTALIIGSL
jgi:hypothetical protein